MLPTALKNHISVVGEQFGGYTEVENLLPQSQLYYLALFPGPFFVTTPWIINTSQFENYAPNLVLAGHLENQSFRVYNREMGFLFESNSKLFGEKRVEKLLVDQAYHGEFFHLELVTETGPKLVILWVSKIVPRSVQERRLRDLRKTIQPQSRKHHELFIKNESDEEITIYSIAGGKRQSGLAIKQSGSALSVTIKKGRLARLTPRVNTWYVFESGEQFLRVSLSGEGEDRWQDFGDAYYFEAQNKFQASSNRLDLSDFSLSRGSQANLFGTLTSLNVITGSSLVVGIVSEAENLNVSGSIDGAHLSSSIVSGRLISVTFGLLSGQSLGPSSGSFSSSSIVSGEINASTSSESTGQFSSTTRTNGLIIVEPFITGSFDSSFEESAFESIPLPRSTGFITSSILN